MAHNLGYKDILLEFKPSPFSLVLRGKFQVASFDAFSGDLKITQSGSDFLFGATVSIACLVKFTVAGQLDLSNIGNSKIDLCEHVCYLCTQLFKYVCKSCVFLEKIR